MEAIRLNIGSGGVPLPGYENIDRKAGREAYPLEYADGTVDEIRASHVLEHFGWADVPNVIADWSRALKPGGCMRLAVPNFDYIARQYGGAHVPPELLFRYAMGGQTDDNDYHRSMFDRASLTATMRQEGLERIRPWMSDVDDCAALPVSLNLQGFKREKRNPIDLPRIVALMSKPRIGFTANSECAMHVFGRTRTDIHTVYGAYWGQCLERGMTMVLEDKAEWLVTLDYDTVFNMDIFSELCYQMAAHPEADALAPWQCKRECDEPLVWITDNDGNQRTHIPLAEFEDDVTPADTAHFGLTILKVEALLRMPHPWFHSTPNQDGRWEEGRVDDDISFWHKWKESGNTLYMANHVPLGHAQQVISWPGHDFKPVHQYFGDFQTDGPPMEARQ